MEDEVLSRSTAKLKIVPNKTGENKTEKSLINNFREADKERIELEGRRQYFFLRKIWSTIIIFWISILIFENLILLILTGKGVFDFKNYQWFILSVSVESFLQIVGMGYVAVRFLFPVENFSEIKKE